MHLEMGVEPTPKELVNRYIRKCKVRSILNEQFPAYFIYNSQNEKLARGALDVDSSSDFGVNLSFSHFPQSC